MITTIDMGTQRAFLSDVEQALARVPELAEALETTRRLLGPAVQAECFGKCLGYELWVRDMPFDIERLTGSNGEQRFLIVLSGRAILEVHAAQRPEQLHDLHQELVKRALPVGISVVVDQAGHLVRAVALP
ncbi:MAG: hypothetical protein KF905_08900 [Flavobacteriales bacterium]|nr:hypothetical protein [Flavobacteriales bacterium]